MPNAKRLDVHPLCKIIPEPDADDYARLLAGIKQDGLRQPIVLYEEKILDGRSRYRACLEAKIEPRFETYSGDDPLSFVLAMNVARRHLTQSQKALVAGRMANLDHGQRKDQAERRDKKFYLSHEDAADRLGVSRPMVSQARTVLASGDAALIGRVERGEVAVDKAASQVRTTRRAESTVAPPVPGRRGTVLTVAEWKKLTSVEQERVLATEGQVQFNAQQTLDIEWARWSTNPVTGCEHNCPYCYARDIAEGAGRLAPLYPTKFQPALWPTAITAPKNTKVPEDKVKADLSYRNVFLCSMADLFGKWVPKEWIDRILQEAADNPQWNFLCLTKFPQRLSEFEFPDNVWMGTTVDVQARVKNAEAAFAKVRCKTKWLSCEPLLTPLKFSRLDVFQWMVVGGASASAKTPAWRPPMDWLVSLHSQARAAGLRVYYKTNWVGDETRIREFPWQEPAPRQLPDAFRYLKDM